MHMLPLQHKKLHRLVLPYLQVGTCEVMNNSPTYNMDSFTVFNNRNCGLYKSHAAASNPLSSSLCPYMGEMVGSGLLDSHTGPTVSRFVSRFLSRALHLHAVTPNELSVLRKSHPRDPLVDIMIAAASRRRTLRRAEKTHDADDSLMSVVVSEDMQQYALAADASFFYACERLKMGAARGDKDLSAAEAADVDWLSRQLALQHSPAGPSAALSECRDSDCRGVWFTATVAPPALDVRRQRALLSSSGRAAKEEDEETQRMSSQHGFCLDVVVGNVGDCRAFGIARNPLTFARKSALDPSRERVVALSEDHPPLHHYDILTTSGGGGGAQDSATGDHGSPQYSASSRHFGDWTLKRGAVNQTPQVTALPSTAAWEMLPGDALVLTNHALFEARGVGGAAARDTTVDELATIAGRGLGLGHTPDAVAAALCDHAVRLGSPHSLQATVLVASDVDVADASCGGGDDYVRTATQPQHQQWVEPGPLYVEACRSNPAFRSALRRDCERCGISVDELVRLRWERVRDVLPLRHSSPLMACYAGETWGLQQVMEEEARFFQGLGVNSNDQDSSQLWQHASASLFAQ